MKTTHTVSFYILRVRITKCDIYHAILRAIYKHALSILFLVIIFIDSPINEDLSFTFNPTTFELNATVQIPYDLNLNVEEFKIIIYKVDAVGYGRITGVDTGEPLTVDVSGNINCMYNYTSYTMIIMHLLLD